MEKLLQHLKEFSPTVKDGYVEITLPVVIWLCGTLLTVRIAPTDDGFTIACAENLFYDANDSQEFYFDLFMKWDKNYHFAMQKDGDVIYKAYPQGNLNVAINEFIRFFILFDDFILQNGVIGHEEKFV